MNFYASRDYLDAAAAIYFKGRRAAIENVAIGDDVFRLLVIDGRRAITELQFLDLHQPLTGVKTDEPMRRARYARNVVRETVGIEDANPDSVGRANLAPFANWSKFASFADYQNWLLQRHKGLVRDRERRWRSLSAAYGEPAFTMDDREDDVLTSALNWKSAQLRATNKKDYCGKPETMAFLRLLRDRGLLVSSTLRVAGRIISVWVGFVHDGSWSGWIFTYDPAFRKYSAGHQLLSCMLEESYALGHEKFDFSQGAEDYKLIYATHARILGEAGRKPPLAFAKSAIQQHSPQMFRLLQSAKKVVGGAPVRVASGEPAKIAGG